MEEIKDTNTKVYLILTWIRLVIFCVVFARREQTNAFCKVVCGMLAERGTQSVAAMCVSLFVQKGDKQNVCGTACFVICAIAPKPNTIV